jgi:YgiT-type zinc finger domain-containing protein
MKCYYCQNKLRKDKVTYNINRNGYDVILREVPAFVCQECGEIFFEEKSVDMIQSLISDVDKKAEAVRKVPLGGISLAQA